MRRINVLLFAAMVALAIPAVVQAAGGGLHSAASPGVVSSTSTITVTIPSVVAIDVETDVTFDLTTYIGGAGCNNNFPPSLSCSTATFAANGSTTTGPAPVPAAHDIWVAAFNNRTTGGSTLADEVASAWAPSGGPGFATTMLATEASASNQTATVTGNSAFTNLTTTFVNCTSQGLPATGYGWTRIDQAIEINLTTIPTTFNIGTFTTTVTFQLTTT